MIRIVLLCLLTSLLFGCLPESKNCWSAETKQSTKSLFSDVARARLVALARKGSPGRVWTPEARTQIADGLELSLSDYYAISSDYATDALRCGANVKVAWTRRDGTKFTAKDRLVEFNIYKSEVAGKVFYVTHESGSLGSTLQSMFDGDED